MEVQYDFYSFGGDTIHDLDMQTFSKSKRWAWQLLQARQSVPPLKEYQGRNALKDEFNEVHINKLNIPSQDPRVILVIDYDVFVEKHNKIRPARVIKACSNWNESFDAQIYICVHVNPGSEEHSKSLARFSDPAFQRVFEGLFIISKDHRKSFEEGNLLENIREDIFNEDNLPMFYVDRNLFSNDFMSSNTSNNRFEKLEKYIEHKLEETED